MDVWLSEQLIFVSGMECVLIVAIVAGITIFSGELMSNTAGAALLIPVMVSLSSTIHVDPILLMVPVTLATSFNFVMPVGTPPNAIVIGSGHVGAKQMARYGLPLNIMGIIIVTIMTVFLVPLVFAT